MLTRIEIDGFKTFDGFAMDLNPFMVVLGPNASGKSNLFDAIRLLTNLAGTDLRTAVKGLRGETSELFRRGSNGAPGDQMGFAVEVLLEPVVRDPWGSEVKIAHSRVRYEVTIERRSDDRGIERLIVTHEDARPIFTADDRWRPGPERTKPSNAFRKAFVKYGGRRSPFLSTDVIDGKASFQIHHDGRAGRTRSAVAAEATILSSITSAEFPHLYALREEMRAYRFLQLDPAALRRPSQFTAAEELEPDGSNLATVLARIQAETRSERQPKGALADVAADLSSLIPGVLDLSVEEDRQNREYRVDISVRDGPPFSSRVVSDGTLRVLALLTLLHDPKHRGLVCFEEPENGVHPFRLKAMIRRLRELVTDPAAPEVSDDEALSQILMNSHSPVVLSSLEVREGEIVFADMVGVAGGTNGTSRKTRVRSVGVGRLDLAENGASVSSQEVNRYLSSVEQPKA